MKSIDERIVDMQFNNKQFEDGIHTSLQSLDNLKKGLNDASKDDSLSELQSGIEGIADKFSSLGIMGVTALQNITTAAMNTGIALVKSLTIDPVKSGLQEYETKMNAITTILTNTESKGTTLNDVNTALANLNDYADLTIYNFAEMTRNIGTFTAAGVDLDTSVTAIKGIANLAAGSGSTSQQASTAMYQLSQALASGGVKLQDWNSVVNAGMGGELFKNTLLDIAKNQGIITTEFEEGQEKIVTYTKKGGKELKTFRDSLSDGWLSSDVLVSALTKFANDETLVKAATEVKTVTQLLDTMKESVQSGWAVSWEHIIGDKEQATKTLTAISDAFNALIEPSTDARNAMLKFWNENGGRDAIIQAVKNSFDGLMQILTPIKEAFREFFPAMTGEKLVAFSEGLRDLTEKFKIGEETTEHLKQTFSGLFAFLDMGGMFFSTLFQGVSELIGVILPIGDGVLALTAKFGDWGVSLHDAAKEGDVFNTALQNIKNFIQNASDSIAPWIDRIIAFFGNLWVGVEEGIRKLQEKIGAFHIIDLSPISAFTDRVEVRFRPFTALGDLFKVAFDAIMKVLEWAAPIFIQLGSIIGEAFQKLSMAVGDLGMGLDFNSILDLINGGLFVALISGVNQFIDSLAEVTSGAGGMLDSLKGILDGVRGSLEAYQQNLKAKSLLTIATAIGLLAASLLVLSLIEGEKLAVALAAITTLFAELAGTLTILNKSMSGAGGVLKASGLIIAMASAILILSVAMKNLAELDYEELVRGSLAMATMTAMLTGAATTLSKSSGQLIKGSTGLIAFATAILILVQAVKALGGMDTDSLMKGLVGVGVIMVEIAGFTNIVKAEKLISTGLAMIAMGAGLNIIASAVESLGTLDSDELAKGLIGLGVVLAEMAGFSNIIKPDKLISTGLAMIAMGAALTIIADAVLIFGSMKLEELAKGLTAMGIALVEIAGFTHIINPEKMLGTSIAMIAMGAALLLIAQAVQDFGGMTWEEIAKGLITLGGALLIITTAMNAMTGCLAGAAAMLVMAGAITILAPALALLGSMDLAEIGKSLLALVGVFTVIGVAGLLLAPLTPAILALAGAVALLGVGVLAIGGGLLMFSAGLTSLAVAGTAGAAALVVVVSALLGLIPLALTKLGEGVIAFAGVITNGMPAIMEAVTAIMTGLIQVLVEIAPQVIEAVLVFLGLLLQTLTDHVPSLVDAGLKLFIGILEGIAMNIKDIVTLALLIISEFLLGIAEGLPGVVQAAVDVIVAFLDSIGKQSPRIIDAAFKMMIDFINGLAESIRENTGTLVESIMNLASAIIEGLIDGLFSGTKGVVDAIINVAKAIWEGFKNFFGIKSPSRLMTTEGENVSKGLQEGVRNGENSAVTAIKNVGKAMMDGISEAVRGIGDVASNLISGLRDGITNGIGIIGKAAKNLGNELLGGIKGALGIKSPSKRMAEVGTYSGLGLVKGLNSMKNKVSKSAGAVGDTAAMRMKESLSKVSDVMQGDMDMTPVIRPVLDLDEVDRGLSSAFSKEQYLHVGEIKGRAATVATSDHQNRVISSAGDSSTDNSEQRLAFYITNVVRNDNDIQKINAGLGNIVTKFNRARGLAVHV